jgi:hypothetical protein
MWPPGPPPEIESMSFVCYFGSSRFINAGVMDVSDINDFDTNAKYKDVNTREPVEDETCSRNMVAQCDLQR